MTARILVVDDILVNVRLMEARLTAEYFDVHTATSGAEALAMLDNAAYDIVLLDVMMPGMDGPALLALLREMPATAKTPVIFMTAKVQASEVALYKGLGALEVIAKPFDPMALSDQLRRIWALQVLPA